MGQVPAEGDAAGEVAAGGVAQVQAEGVPAPVREVPAHPPKVDVQEDPDLPEGAMIDALLDLEVPAVPDVVA